MADFPWWPQLAFVLFFAGLWCSVCFLLSYISGWALLAEHYRAALPFAGRYERLPSSQMGRFGIFGGARNAVYIAVDADGLHLKMFVLFRINCPNLFIPWRDISVRRGRTLVFDYVELRFAKAQPYGLRIFGKTADVVRALAGPAWPREAAPDVVTRST